MNDQSNNNQVAVADRKVDHAVADLIAIEKGGINFENAGQLMEYAKMMASSMSAVPKHLRGQPGACLGILDDAVRYGFNPYALARKSYFVNDQLAYEAQVFMAIINARAPLKQPPDLAFEGEGQGRRAKVTGEFLDGRVREYISPPVSEINPKNSPLWKSDTDQQLAYYSFRAFARRWCPETIMGVYDIDEIRDAAMVDVSPKPAEAQPAKPRTLGEFADAASAGAEARRVETARGTPQIEQQASEKVEMVTEDGEVIEAAAEKAEEDQADIFPGDLPSKLGPRK